MKNVKLRCYFLWLLGFLLLQTPFLFASEEEQDGFGDPNYRMLWEGTDIHSPIHMTEVTGVPAGFCFLAFNQRRFSDLQGLFRSDSRFGSENAQRTCHPTRLVIFSTYYLCKKYAAAERYDEIVRESNHISIPADVYNGELTKGLQNAVRNFAMTQATVCFEKLLLGDKFHSAQQLGMKMRDALNSLAPVDVTDFQNLVGGWATRTHDRATAKVKLHGQKSRALENYPELVLIEVAQARQLIESFPLQDPIRVSLNDCFENTRQMFVPVTPAEAAVLEATRRVADQLFA